MKSLEDGSKKIKQICDLLKNDAIEPAKKESEAILEAANAKAQEMLEQAENQIRKMQADAKAAIEQERNVFQSFMVQAAKQTIETLKQQIEHHFFSNEIQQLVDKTMSDPKLIARIIEVIIQAIEKEGISADLSAIIPKKVPAKEVNANLAENILQKLKEKSVVLGGFSGGAQIKLQDKKVTIDISDNALIELLSVYRKGFRELFFQR